MGLESSCFNPSQLQPIQELQSYTELQSYRATQSFRASELPELRTEVRIQSFENRYKNAQNTVKHRTFRDLVMGNRSKDENAAASNNTKDRDQESNSRDQDTRDTSLAKAIAEAVAQQTQAITDVFQRQMEETRAQYEELFKASRTQNFTSTLKVTSSTDGFRVMDAFDWTSMTRTSTRDGSCGLTRQD